MRALKDGKAIPDVRKHLANCDDEDFLEYCWVS